MGCHQSRVKRRRTSNDDEKVYDALNDCVALLQGQVTGPMQREKIVNEAIEALGDRYAGPERRA